MIRTIQKGVEAFHSTQSPSETTSKEAVSVSPKIENITDAKSSTDTKIDSQKKLDVLIKQLNSALDPFQTSIKFGFDDSSKDFYVSVIEAKTNKMIRRFPAEHAQSLLPKMKEVIGMLFDQKG